MFLSVIVRLSLDYFTLAQTIVTIQIRLPKNKETISKTMLMKRHQRIAPLFTDKFWDTH